MTFRRLSLETNAVIASIVQTISITISISIACFLLFYLDSFLTEECRHFDFENCEQLPVIVAVFSTANVTILCFILGTVFVFLGIRRKSPKMISIMTILSLIAACASSVEISTYLWNIGKDAQLIFLLGAAIFRLGISIVTVYMLDKCQKSFSTISGVEVATIADSKWLIPRFT